MTVLPVLEIAGHLRLTALLRLAGTAGHLYLAAMLHFPGIAWSHNLMAVNLLCLLITATHHLTAVLHRLRTVRHFLTVMLHLPGTAKHHHLRTVQLFPGLIARLSSTFRELSATHHRVPGTRQRQLRAI